MTYRSGRTIPQGRLRHVIEGNTLFVSAGLYADLQTDMKQFDLSPMWQERAIHRLLGSEGLRDRDELISRVVIDHELDDGLLRSKL